MTIDWIVIGGFACGALAGASARYGRLCTMSAVEDALVGHDYRGVKAWGLALAVAILATQTVVALGLVDVTRSLYGGPRLHLLGVVLGGVLFGLGMTLVGTCSFGLLVRAGGGDLKSAVSALVVGIVAIASTAGLISHVRTPMLEFGHFSMETFGGSTITGILSAAFGPTTSIGIVGMLTVSLVLFALFDGRLRNRPRLLLGSVGLGLAVATAWLVTGLAVAQMALDRPESLTFVAPVGRALLQLMMEPFRNLGFGVATAGGAFAASALVALWRQELRWEAFDDAIEMRRHLAGAALMGIGGVLAQGCTIGQGLSAASTLALSAPIFIVSVLIGSKVGLTYLIEGRAIWRLGR